MSAQIIDGKAIAQKVRSGLGKEVASFQAKTGIQPHLAAVLIGEDPASAVYVRSKQRACEQTGIGSTLHKLHGARRAARRRMLEQQRKLLHNDGTGCRRNGRNRGRQQTKKPQLREKLFSSESRRTSRRRCSKSSRQESTTQRGSFQKHAARNGQCGAKRLQG